jgi:hypothetical protein
MRYVGEEGEKDESEVEPGTGGTQNLLRGV